MKTATFKVEGMRCSACATTIKTLVEMEAGVRMAAVSFETAEARILYDPQAITEDRLVGAIQRPGYRVVARQ